MPASVQSRIRPMTHADLKQVLAWRNDPVVRRYMYTQHEISLDEHVRWFERASQDANRYLLVFENDGVPLGFINIHQITIGGVADWGFYAAPDAPKGTGRQLGKAVQYYVFVQAGLHKLCGQALVYNGSPRLLHQGLGVQQEGVLREQHFDGQNYHDVVCFGLLASEWQANL